MTNEKDRAAVEMPHSVTIDDRERMTVTGVTEVLSFDEQLVVLETANEQLTVQGSDMHIEKLNLDNGELSLSGTIAAIEYSDGVSARRAGLWSRLFG